MPLGLMLRSHGPVSVQAHRDHGDLFSGILGQEPAAGARTTSGTAGKYAAISEREARRAAVP